MYFMIICIFYLQRSNQTTTQHRSKGLNAIEINIDSLVEIPSDQTTIVITLKQTVYSSYPILSYCPTSNLQSIKTIFSSLNQVKAHIESNKKQCIFDNNAVLYNKELQQITLFDYQNEDSEWIYNRFACFGIKNRKLSIYIYSNDYSEYEIIVRQQNQENCLNQNGQCSKSTPSVCECSQNTLGSNCQIQFSIINIFQQSQIMLNSKQPQLYFIPISDQKSSIEVKIDSQFPIGVFLTCQYEKEFIPFPQSQGYEQKILQNGKIIYFSENIKECKDRFIQINSQIIGNIQPKLILLLVNNENFFQTNLQISVSEYIEETKSNSLIFYILAGAFSTILLMLIFGGIRYYILKRKDEIHIQNRIHHTNVTNHQSESHQRQISKDFIPVELYEQIIQEYPGLNYITDCQICLVEFQNQDLVKLTFCLHLFHSTCLDAWRKKNQICPFCRAEITKKCLQEQKQQLEIFQLGSIAGDEIQLDQKKAEEIKQRQQRLNQLKKIESPDSIQTIKDTSPSPQSGVPLQKKIHSQIQNDQN